MAEKSLGYFKIFSSFSMIKVKCRSWFLRFVFQVNSNWLSSWALSTNGGSNSRVNYGPTLLSANWVESTWDTNLKNQLLHSTFIILKELKIMKYTKLFSNTCRVMRSTKSHDYSLLSKWFWLFHYTVEYKLDLSRVKPLQN